MSRRRRRRGRTAGPAGEAAPAAGRGAPAAFDWAGLMRAGIGGLGLEPRVFWALTPLELMLMLGLETGEGSAPMTRATLDRLARAFADDAGTADRQGETSDG